MKLVIQRVAKASVAVDEQIIGQIDQGLLVLLGVADDDTEDKIPWLVNKLASLRIFTDEIGKMNLSIEDIKGEVLIVSQFTLYGNCNNGRRPDFIQAARPEKAERLYNEFVLQAKEKLEKVETGKFAAKMAVRLVNDGPVTLIIER